MTDAMPDTDALYESRLRSLPLLARGKVRENYAVGDDRLLMVASDRISAFDVIMGQPIPGKGRLLTRMALFWFARLAHVVPNHLSGDDPLGAVAEDERAVIEGRSMLVKRLRPLPVEAVVRGYLAGSGWAEYQRGHGVRSATAGGCATPRALAEPIFTPATVEAGARREHRLHADAGPRRRRAGRRVRGARAVPRGRSACAGPRHHHAYTKFEFGLDRRTLTLMDEVLTPTRRASGRWTAIARVPTRRVSTSSICATGRGGAHRRPAGIRRRRRRCRSR